MNSFKKFTQITVLLVISSSLMFACKTKEPEPAATNNTTGNPKTDYLKIGGGASFTGSDKFTVTAGFKGITRITELKISAGNGSLRDTFLSIEHDTLLLDFPCKSGMGKTFKDSTVRFFSRLSFISGAPVLLTEMSAKKYGSYIVKMENGRRVSYFSGIELVDNQTSKRYTCEGRITWPQ